MATVLEAWAANNDAAMFPFDAKITSRYADHLGEVVVVLIFLLCANDDLTESHFVLSGIERPVTSGEYRHAHPALLAAGDRMGREEALAKGAKNGTIHSTTKRKLGAIFLA